MVNRLVEFNIILSFLHETYSDFGYLGCVLFLFSFKTIHFICVRAYLSGCVSVNVYHLHAGSNGGQNIRLLEAEFQAVVSFAVWALGFGHGSSGTAENTLNHGAI